MIDLVKFHNCCGDWKMDFGLLMRDGYSSAPLRHL